MGTSMMGGGLGFSMALLRLLGPGATLIIPVLPAAAEIQPARSATAMPTLRFAGHTYQHRWSGRHQHEFTPTGQEDLSRWSDMITINLYPAVRDGDGLAEVANRVLGTYQANNGTVVRTASRPRTAQHSAEHLIVVLLPSRDAIEVAFARFRMDQGMGTAVIYSHRVPGRQAGEAMARWLEAEGPATEERLMALSELPPPLRLEPDLGR